MKTCADVQQEINELKKKLQQDRNIRFFLRDKDLSEQQKCDSESRSFKCEKCNCWKSAKEHYS